MIYNNGLLPPFVIMCDVSMTDCVYVLQKSAIKKFVKKGGKKIVERGNTAKHQVKSFTLMYKYQI